MSAYTNNQNPKYAKAGDTLDIKLLTSVYNCIILVKYWDWIRLTVCGHALALVLHLDTVVFKGGH